MHYKLISISDNNYHNYYCNYYCVIKLNTETRTDAINRS